MDSREFHAWLEWGATALGRWGLDEASAHEVAADVLTEVMRRTVPFSSALYGQRLRQRALDRDRNDTRRRIKEERAARRSWIPPPPSRLEEAEVRAAFNRAINAAMARLDKASLTALACLHLEGFRDAPDAPRIRIPRRTLGRRRSRALRAFAEELSAAGLSLEDVAPIAGVRQDLRDALRRAVCR
jgi:hypothetical protein